MNLDCVLQVHLAENIGKGTVKFVFLSIIDLMLVPIVFHWMFRGEQYVANGRHWSKSTFIILYLPRFVWVVNFDSSIWPVCGLLTASQSIIEYTKLAIIVCFSTSLLWSNGCKHMRIHNTDLWQWSDAKQVQNEHIYAQFSVLMKLIY